jgi:non-specific serine/threonine protein kinase
MIVPEPPSGNLPVPATTFVGRAEETAQVTELLARSRLVTLTGPGGIGKTRLASHLATELRSRFPDGIWLVELSALRDPELLGQAVAIALSVQDHSTRPILEVLTDRLAGRHLLIILDTCEHLVDACSSLARLLLRSAGGIRILATSRQRLDVLGEEIFVVPPFGCGDPGSDAVTLFADRAAAVDPEFEVTGEAVQLCAGLDGMPLAIELAAKRIRDLNVSDMIAALDDRFGLLDRVAEGSVLQVSRHDRLRTTIGWSHELCSPAERLLWARLSVFAGPVGLEAVESTCADEQLPAKRLISLLASLVNKSVLRREVSDGVLCFSMLDTLREYGRDWLRELGEEPVMMRRHRDHYLDVARQFEAGFEGPGQLTWIGRIKADLPEVRAAFDYCAADPAEHEAGLELAGRLNFLWISQQPREGRYQLERALATICAPTANRSRALWGLAYVAGIQGDATGVTGALDDFHRLPETASDPVALAYIQYVHGAWWMYHPGEPAKALPLLEKSLLGLRHGDQSVGVTVALGSIGVAHLLLGELDKAIAVFDDVISYAQANGEVWARSHFEFCKARTELSRGDTGLAARHAAAALSIKQQLDDGFGMLMTVDTLANIAQATGQHHRAARLYGIAKQIAEGTGTSYPSFGNLETFVPDPTQTELGDDTFDAAVAEGAALGRAEAIAYALDASQDR